MKRHNKYWLPKWRRQMVLGFIGSYNDKVDEHRAKIDQLNSPSNMDGQPRGTDITDQTFLKVVSSEKVLDDIRIIEGCIRMIPEQYQFGVWHSVVPDKDGKRWPFPRDAHVNTYSQWRRAYIFYVHNEMLNRGM